MIYYVAAMSQRERERESNNYAGTIRKNNAVRKPRAVGGLGTEKKVKQIKGRARGTLYYAIYDRGPSPPFYCFIKFEWGFSLSFWRARVSSSSSSSSILCKTLLKQGPPRVRV